MEERSTPEGAPIKRFFQLGEEHNGVRYFYTKDHLGSIREVTNTAELLEAIRTLQMFQERMESGGIHAFDDLLPLQYIAKCLQEF